MNAIRILLVDDHTVVRQGLRSLLELEPDFSVVGEASCGSEALPLVEHTRPDIILLDLRLPDQNGIEVCRRLSREHPDIPVIILSAFSYEQDVLDCIDAGAKGYVLKDVDVFELTRAIRAVHRGESVLDPRVTRAVLERFRQAGRGVETPVQLTEQEKEIVRLVAQGLTNKEIARRLFLSPNTVKFHISNIMRKLDVKRRAEIAYRASKNHLL
jgi:two-component system NarL family response regulator